MFTELLARFVVKSRYDDLPDAVIAAAKRGVLDCIAVTLAGSKDDTARALQRHVQSTSGRGVATILTGNMRTSAQLAAYVNGTMAHALDYDDVIHIPPLWMGHPSVVILPAILAIAETHQLAGSDLILAYCLGIEIYTTVGLLCGDLAYQRGWHNTSFIGTMAAAGAVARLLEADELRMRRSFGIAASMAGGLRQNFGTMTKPLHAGLAARNGVEAALLAEAGVTADESIFEAPLGFRRVFTGERSDVSQAIPYGAEIITPDMFAARLGRPWRIATPGLAFKICPSCRATHFGMEAALEYRRVYGGDTQPISEIECHVPDHMRSVLFYHDPRKGLEGKFSLEYVLARTLIDGVPKIADFTDARVNEPAVKALIRRMRWISFTPAAGSFGIPVFLFKMADRPALRCEVQYPRGEPEHPVADEVLIEKFQDCVRMSLSAEASKQVRDCILALENVRDLSELTTLLR